MMSDRFLQHLRAVGNERRLALCSHVHARRADPSDGYELVFTSEEDWEARRWVEGPVDWRDLTLPARRAVRA